MAIFDSQAKEEVLVSLIELFVKRAGRNKYLFFQHDESAFDPLYQTLHRHYDKPCLLEELFKHGCSQQCHFLSHQGSDGLEQVSPLLWVLCHGNHNIKSQIVDILLKYKGQSSGSFPV